MRQAQQLAVVLALTGGLLAGSPPARAQVQCAGPSPSDQVCINPGTGASQLAAALGTTTSQLTSSILSQVNNLFQVTNVGAFLRDFQNAQAFASKSLGVDYASETTRVEVGATLSVASDLDKAYKPSGSYTNPPVSGGGANFSLMGGLGLGLFGLDSLMIFANWFQGSADLGQLQGSYDNWGVHGQLRLLAPGRNASALKALVRWGGIAITSGADYSRVTLNAKSSIQATSFALPSYTPSGPQGSVTVQDTGIFFALDQTTWAVPLELTTSLRLFSLITFYGGIGLDFQLGGGSDLRIAMNSGGNSANLIGSVGGNTYSLGSASINVGQHENPSPARFREILGVQLGIFDVVRIFLQVNNSPSPELTSLAAGLRIGW
ncbi:MAG: hypothetical protein ABSB49_11750 [Polyangia bacterium]|jgi:hypothetical protein